MNWPTWRPANKNSSDIAAILSGDGQHLLNRGLRLLDDSDVPSSVAQHATAATSSIDHGSAEDELHGCDEGATDDTAWSGLGPLNAWTSWPLDLDRYSAAVADARPYAGQDDAAEQAWSARVDAAVQAMDARDPAGLDQWMQVHADSGVPHVYEARLVASWETAQADPDVQVDVDDL